jgi:hypothetical protein
VRPLTIKTTVAALCFSRKMDDQSTVTLSAVAFTPVKVMSIAFAVKPLTVIHFTEYDFAQRTSTATPRRAAPSETMPADGGVGWRDAAAAQVDCRR